MGKASQIAVLLAIASCAWSAPNKNKRWLGETRTENGVKYQCKCYSDNACWPKANDWNKLNKTVDGRLEVVLPPAAACHNEVTGVATGTYDAAACAEVQANWQNEQYLTDDEVAALWPFATNNTCLPTDNPQDPCSRGFYGDYVIMATKKQHIKAGIDFAREKNLRLLIRNTGHDFMGRSVGYGSLMINTHSFKDVKFHKKYNGPGSYKGPAATVGAGVQGRELYGKAFAQSPKRVIIGGECPTVGWAGGYIQGGGHGPLTSIYGMAADSVLAFDVITADGKYVKANEKQNSDLYWALKGGGPSTFAAVLSVDVKTYPEVKNAVALVNINATHTTDPAVFDKAFKIFHNLSNHYTAHGMFVYFEHGFGSLHIHPFLGPNMDIAKLKTVLKPLFDQWNAAGIPYSTPVYKEFSTFYEMYIDIFEDEAPNQQSVVGGRIFSQKDIADNGNAVADALILAQAPKPGSFGINIGHMMNPGYGVPDADNAIHPTWRNASSFIITNVIVQGQETWAQRKAAEDLNTNFVGKALRAASPNGAAYVNEGDLKEPNWQEAYWGSKYPKLLQIRKKFDPEGVFYAETTPGTENWSVIDYGKRLCKKI